MGSRTEGFVPAGAAGMDRASNLINREGNCSSAMVHDRFCLGTKFSLIYRSSYNPGICPDHFVV